MKINLAEVGRDDHVQEGIYSIATRDIGAQYFMVKRQAPGNWFAGGALAVFKVEIVASVHEEVLFKRNKWRIWYSEDMGQVLAYKMFAFASNRGVAVWNKYKDDNYPLGGAKTIADTPATLVITKEETEVYKNYYPTKFGRTRLPAKRTTDVSLWQAYANVLWEYIQGRTIGASKTIDSEGREICRLNSSTVPGGAIRPLDYMLNN